MAGNLSSGSGRARIGGIELRDLDVFRQTELLEQPDPVVIGIKLVPLQAVAGGDGVSVMVVVPALAAGQQRDPPAVAGVVVSIESALAHMCVAELTSHVA